MHLRPLRALAHPLWLASLGLLLVNDHVLKGAGLLPAWTTGKLSDMAGLIVAPLLLAALLGLATRGRVLVAHIAVGVIFASLQLVPSLAAAWDGALTAIGLTWHTVADPSDLLALPALWVSWWTLTPAAIDGPLRPRERAVATAGGVVGLVACCATSRVGPIENAGGGFPDIWAQAWVHNDSTDAVVVRLRQLRPSVELDCDALLADDPGGLLTESLFEPAVVWELPAFTTVSALDDLRVDLTDRCHAVLVEGDTFDSQVLLWPSRDPVTVLGEIFDETSPITWGRLTLPTARDVDGISWTLQDLDPGTCLPQSELDRLEWTSPFLDAARLDAVELSPDGCMELELTTKDRVEDMFLCMPESLFPFEVGEVLEIHVPAVGPLELYGRQSDTRLTLLQVDAPVELASVSLESFIDAAACGAFVSPACDGVAVDAVLHVNPSGGVDGVDLRAGEQKTFLRDDDRTTIVHAVRAEHRIATDTACTWGATDNGADVEAVVIDQPTNSTLPTQ